MVENSILLEKWHPAMVLAFGHQHEIVKQQVLSLFVMDVYAKKTRLFGAQKLRLSHLN